MAKLKALFISAALLNLVFPSACHRQQDGNTFDPEFKKFSQVVQRGDFYNIRNKGLSSNAFLLPNVGKKFSCDIISRDERQKPNSVHELSPYDVDVVAAMGDSLTAAQAAKSASLFTVFEQFRGMSFSIGGDGEVENTATLPNILKKFNPNVKGFSLQRGDEETAQSHLNVAVSGAVSMDLISQARKLVEKMTNDKSLNFNNDWKVLTILIGANDLCRVCKTSKFMPEKYVDNIKQALDYLHANVPRMFVSFISTVDVTGVNDFKSLKCDLVHAFACPCTETDKESTLKNLKDYRRLVEELIQTRRYDTREDFTVVFQPFTSQSVLPTTKGRKSFIALDCFHFSVLAHASAAQALWKNMMEPVGKKSKSWNPEQDFIDCPTHPEQYFYTNMNSGTQTSVSSKTPKRKKTYQKISDAGRAVLIIYVAFGLITVVIGVWGIAAFIKRRRYRKAITEKMYAPYQEFIES